MGQREEVVAQVGDMPVATGERNGEVDKLLFVR